MEEKVINVYTDYRTGVTRTTRLLVDPSSKEVDITLTLTKSNQEVQQGHVNLSTYELRALINAAFPDVMPGKAIINRYHKQ